MPGLAKTTFFRSLSANFINQAGTAFCQFAGVPILIYAFGVHQYGEYLTLSAIPAFLFFADLGLGISLSNEMTIAYAANKRKLAQVYSSTSMVFATYLSLFILALSAAITFVDVKSIFGLSAYTNSYYKQTFLFLVMISLGSHICGVLAYNLRAINRNATGVYLLVIQRVSVLVVIWLGAIYFKSMLGAVLVALVYQVMYVTASFIFYSRKYKNELSVSLKWFSPALLRRSLKPALSYLLFPLGNSLLLNGLTIVFNRYAGTNAVVMFVSTRTLSNLLKQASVLINHSVWPELTIAYGQNNLSRLKKMFGTAMKGSFIASIVLFFVSLVVGKLVFKTWLGDKVEFDFLFYVLMMMSAIFYALWSTALMLPTAINKFAYTGKVYIITTLAGFCAIVVIAQLSPVIYYPVAITLLVTEILLFILFYPHAKKMLVKLEQQNRLI